MSQNSSPLASRFRLFDAGPHGDDLKGLQSGGEPVRGFDSRRVEALLQLGAYSAPDRDPRHHTITVVFLARAQGKPQARDDAKEVGVFMEYNLPSPLAFDHAQILADYFSLKKAK